MKKLLKKILSLFYREGKSYRVLIGPLRGTRMVYRRDVNYMEMIGYWEKDSLRLLEKVFQMTAFSQSVCVADVGANLGFYSLYFAKRLPVNSTVFAFEPSHTVFDLLRSNIDTNKLSNVTIIEAACSDKTGEQIFYTGRNHHQSSFFSERADTDSNQVVIQTVALDDYFKKTGAYPDFIKMDIEGAAVFALKGCRECFTIKRPVMLIESHSAAEDDAIGEHIRKYEYEAYRVSNQKWVKNKSANYTDPEGVWGTMLVVPAEEKSHYNF